MDIKSGKILISESFSIASPFSGDIAAVQINSQYIIFINKAGKPFMNKKFYTKRLNSAEFSGESFQLDCRYIGGFVNGKIILRYFDEDGFGPEVYGLVDKMGNVYYKKVVSQNEEIDLSADPVFSKYQWKINKK